MRTLISFLLCFVSLISYSQIAYNDGYVSVEVYEFKPQKMTIKNSDLINDTLLICKIERFYCNDTLSTDSLSHKSLAHYNENEKLLSIEDEKTKRQFFFLDLVNEFETPNEIIRIFNDINSNYVFYITYETSNNQKTITDIQKLETIGQNENGELFFNTKYSK
jgi:hypothetical protein